MASEELKYNYITKKWGGIKLQKEFDGIIEKWITQFEDDEKEIVFDILKHYNYFTTRKIANRIELLFKKFIDTYNEDPKSIVFIPVYKDYGVGFSDEFFNKFWMNNNLKESSEKNIDKLLGEGNIIKKIAIVDDYSGSGKTIRNTIKRCIEVNEDSKNSIYYILTIQMSVKAKKVLNDFANEQKLNICICSLEVSEKVFENQNIFEQSIADKKKNEYINICMKYNVHNRYRLGHEKTQALLTFYYNTPNNTLGLFWAANEKYNSIFKRYEPLKTTLSEMQKKTKARKKEQECEIVKKHEIDERYNYLMAYLLNKDIDLNYHKARAKFGMTEEQMDEAITYLMKNDFIIISSGRIKATNKLKEYIKISKVKEVKNEQEKSVENNKIQDNISYIPRNFEMEFGGYK